MNSPAAPTRLGGATLVGAIVLLGAVMVFGAAYGPVKIPFAGVLAGLVDSVPGVTVESGLSSRQLDILRLVRLPRVVLGALVGSVLALSGAAYQAVFRNPLADPFLLGVAAGAGLGATLAVVGSGGGTGGIPAAAFAGALTAVILVYGLSRVAGRSSNAVLILAGVAVAAFLTAIQTFVQQRNDETVRQVYSWILGRLSTSGWDEVILIFPYVGVSTVIIWLHRRLLDVLALGEEEAASVGVDVRRVRTLVVGAATLGTAVAVAVSGLIGFVGIIVPHAVRLLFGSANRVVLPLAALGGAAFLVAADVLARTALAPAELPIGVVTAFTGAPFFALALRRRTVA